MPPTARARAAPETSACQKESAGVIGHDGAPGTGLPSAIAGIRARSNTTSTLAIRGRPCTAGVLGRPTPARIARLRHWSHWNEASAGTRVRCSIVSAPLSTSSVASKPCSRTRRRSRVPAVSRHRRGLARLEPVRRLPRAPLLGPDAAVLVVADFHLPDVRTAGVPVVTYRSYDFRTPPDPAGELRVTLVAALDEAGIRPGPIGVESQNLPHAVAEWLREAGRTPVACDAAGHRGATSLPLRTSTRSAAPAGSPMSSSRPSRTTPCRV